jgi:MFS family permease
LATITFPATIGISFLFRSLGAIVACRYGDRIGRKKMLVFTLPIFGPSTVLIGLLPTDAQSGIAGPIFMIIRRSCMASRSAANGAGRR